MAKNFVKSGNVINFTVPTGGVSSGAPLMIGNLFGIAQTDGAEGASVACAMSGVFEVNKATGAGDDWAANLFAAVYWDDTNKVFTLVSAGNTKVGAVHAPAGINDTRGQVRLDGVAT